MQISTQNKKLLTTVLMLSADQLTSNRLYSETLFAVQDLNSRSPPMSTSISVLNILEA